MVANLSLEPSLCSTLKQITWWIKPLALCGVDQQPQMWPDHLQAIKLFTKVKFKIDNIHQVSGMILCKVSPAYRPTDLQLLVDQPSYSPCCTKGLFGQGPAAHGCWLRLPQGWCLLSKDNQLHQVFMWWNIERWRRNVCGQSSPHEFAWYGWD